MNKNMTTILDKIKEYDKIIIFRHFRPDGDAIGSTKGLREILRLTYPEKTVLLINDDYAEYLAFLGGEDEKIDDEAYPLLVASARIMGAMYCMKFLASCSVYPIIASTH